VTVGIIYGIYDLQFNRNTIYLERPRNLYAIVGDLKIKPASPSLLREAHCKCPPQ
jgi:hypothetical protein